ncbi:transketolase-like TK C-terminal-containing protein [Spirillospora sp. CA-142024]|uniref:transketolase-like TK C-terminal-containing protein n=1 Tax=Spirillospora sp. CA-142024 TaxID=3240036 RepID=UPI003D8CC3AD
MTWSRWGRLLLPIGVLYDPFVERALEPWSYGIYAGGQSILIGTPSGVSLAPEGGAHQSIKTPSIGLEQPGCVSYEPAFVVDTEWTLLAGLARLGKPDGCSAYLRLSTRPVDQSLAAVPADPAARERRRRQVVSGAYPLRRTEAPAVGIAAMGAVVPEALAAAERLEGEGIAADVICVTSPDLLYRAVRARQGHEAAESWILDQVFPADRATPLVTVLDGHPHTLTFLATVNRVPTTAPGRVGGRCWRRCSVTTRPSKGPPSRSPAPSCRFGWPAVAWNCRRPPCATAPHGRDPAGLFRMRVQRQQHGRPSAHSPADRPEPHPPAA